MPKVFIVIPAYNEKEKIAGVINGLKSSSYKDIIVVDDFSSDSTYDAAKKAGAAVLRHVINRGQGASLKTGIDYALKKGADIIVTFDADGQHNAEDIKNVIAPVTNKKADVTLGSRFLDKRSNVPLLKRLTLKAGILFTFIYSGVLLTDTHNGLRAFSRKAAEIIEIKQDRMEHASEIIDEIRKKKLRFKEVPVRISYTEYSIRKGQSPFNSIRIAARLIWSRFLR